MHKWCRILGGGGGSSKIGQNRTWGVGSSSKIGRPIILQFIPPFFLKFWFFHIKRRKNRSLLPKKTWKKLQNNRMSYISKSTYPPCPILSYFAWPPLPPENRTSFMYVPLCNFSMRMLKYLKINKLPTKSWKNHP